MGQLKQQDLSEELNMNTKLRPESDENRVQRNTRTGNQEGLQRHKSPPWQVVTEGKRNINLKRLLSLISRVQQQLLITVGECVSD